MRDRIAALLLTVLIAGQLFGQSELVELEPERTTAVIAPVQTLIRGLPPLTQLEYLPEPWSGPRGGATLPPPILPPPQLEPIEAFVVEAGERVYFSGELGGGVSNAILGNVSIYRLGAPLQFRFSYEHDQQDGFGFRDPGLGFFQQYNVLESWVAWGDSERSVELEVRYHDRERGYQGRSSTYYSANTRAFDATAAGRIDFSSVFGLKTRLRVADNAQVLTVVSDKVGAPRLGETLIEPEAALILDWPRLRLEFGGQYHGRIDRNTKLESSHIMGLGIRAQGIPLVGFTVDGRFDPSLHLGRSPYFPFEIGWQIQAQNRWSFSARGGYQITPIRLQQLWDLYPSLAPVGDTVEERTVERSWFGSAGVEWAAVPNQVNLRLGGTLRDRKDVPIAANYSETAGRFPLSFTNLTMADTRFEIELTPWQRVQLISGWDAHWADSEPGRPPHMIRFTTRYNHDRLGLEAGMALPVERAVVVPLVHLEGRFDLAQNVQLGAYLYDAFSPAIGNRRTPFGREADAAYPFVTPGLAAGLKVRVTF